eukprot:GHRR01025381.1.p2 GENE.GHRR01025381.1~~GHRR01025381.1.p2  ORF type:complete len:153 (+),score=54.62 GHRR01025381.1:1093-1551(+)
MLLQLAWHRACCIVILGVAYSCWADAGLHHPLCPCRAAITGCFCLQGDATAKALVDDLASLMATHINTFDARGLANASWALGKLKYASNPKLPALIAAAAMDKMEAFSAQNLSNLLWSFVYLHHRNDQLLTAVAQQVRNAIQCIMYVLCQHQ